MLDSLQVDLPSQPSLSVDGLPTVKNSRAHSSEPFSAHVRTMIPHVHNKRFTRRRLMVPLVCLILLVSLVGGGGWIFVKQQQLLNLQRATATAYDFQDTTATAHDLQQATATATMTAYNTSIASTVTNATETANSIAPHNAATPNPVLQTTTIDDSVTGTGSNQFNYVGKYWYHSGPACPGPNCSSSYPSYNNTSSWDGQANDYVTLSFTGVQIKLYGVIDPMYGIGAVSIDGGSETSVDFYSSTHQGNQLLWTSPTLSAGTHTFKLRVTNNHNPNARTDTGFPVVLDRVNVMG
jgi:hypothetical protein